MVTRSVKSDMEYIDELCEDYDVPRRWVMIMYRDMPTELYDFITTEVQDNAGEMWDVFGEDA